MERARREEFAQAFLCFFEEAREGVLVQYLGDVDVAELALGRGQQVREVQVRFGFGRGGGLGFLGWRGGFGRGLRLGFALCASASGRGGIWIRGGRYRGGLEGVDEAGDRLAIALGSVHGWLEIRSAITRYKLEIQSDPKDEARSEVRARGDVEVVEVSAERGTDDERRVPVRQLAGSQNISFSHRFFPLQLLAFTLIFIAARLSNRRASRRQSTFRAVNRAKLDERGMLDSSLPYQIIYLSPSIPE
jgi:hypothetical protein